VKVKLWSRPSISTPSTPPTAASPLPIAKLMVKHAVDRDTEPGPGRRAVDRRALAWAPKPGALDQHVQRSR